ncbi:unnamed protein product [Ilex paraguariensis]|uniref:Uncharacterized protein n=1 Tax=Ilex paraguariensis TaxID=185542 RepID=A0ABC8UUL6_9AQUA
MKLANRDAKRLRGKKIDTIDELTIVCGNDQATRAWACSGKYINANSSRQMNDSDDDYTPIFDLNENTTVDDLGGIEGNGSTQQQESGSSQIHAQSNRNHGYSKPMRRNSKKPKNAKIVIETMNVVANNMVRLTDAYEKSKSCINYSDLYKAVMDVEGLDIDSQMTAFAYLNTDSVKARAFLIYPEEMLYLFLIVECMHFRLEDYKFLGLSFIVVVE